MWATFANHGTVNGFQFGVYNADHHGPATLYSEREIRARCDVPDSQQVVTVFGNSDEGDMSSALDGRGPAYAERDRPRPRPGPSCAPGARPGSG